LFFVGQLFFVRLDLKIFLNSTLSMTIPESPCQNKLTNLPKSTIIAYIFKTSMFSSDDSSGFFSQKELETIQIAYTQKWVNDELENRKEDVRRNIAIQGKHCCTATNLASTNTMKAAIIAWFAKYNVPKHRLDVHLNANNEWEVCLNKLVEEKQEAQTTPEIWMPNLEIGDSVMWRISTKDPWDTGKVTRLNSHSITVGNGKNSATTVKRATTYIRILCNTIDTMR